MGYIVCKHSGSKTETPGCSFMFARFLSGFLVVATLGFAQQKPDFAGDYAGTLGPLHVKLHLIAGHDGTLTGTVDSPDQNLFGLPCTDFHVNGQSLSFDVPTVHGAWTGFISGDGTSLSGMWNQGSPVPLNLTRGAAANTTGTTTSSAPLLPASATVGRFHFESISGSDKNYKVSVGGNPDNVVAMIVNGQAMIFQPKLANSKDVMAAYADLKNTPASPTASTSGQQQNGQPSGTPSDGASATLAQANSSVIGSASLEDGTPVVHFHNDPTYGNDIVSFYKKGDGWINIYQPSGREVAGEAVAPTLKARARYEGGGPDTGAGGKAALGVAHVFVAAESNNKKADLTNYGWYMQFGGGKPSGISNTAADNYGKTLDGKNASLAGAGSIAIAAEVLTALKVARENGLLANLPGEQQLRREVGLPPTK